jgi:hypothetical protein
VFWWCGDNGLASHHLEDFVQASAFPTTWLKKKYTLDEMGAWK